MFRYTVHIEGLLLCITACISRNTLVSNLLKCTEMCVNKHMGEEIAMLINLNNENKNIMF